MFNHPDHCVFFSERAMREKIRSVRGVDDAGAARQLCIMLRKRGKVSATCDFEELVARIIPMLKRFAEQLLPTRHAPLTVAVVVARLAGCGSSVAALCRQFTPTPALQASRLELIAARIACGSHNWQAHSR